MADTVIELALSPKSNSGIQAIDAALERIDQGSFGEIPNWLKDAHYQGAKKLGHGVDYQYPHDFPQDWVRQQYLPDKIKMMSIIIPSQTVNLKKPWEFSIGGY